jgi:solute carrier family 27 fatty acid transporter 1/4
MLFLSLQTANYIGEICRYLLATPTSPDDKNHTLRMMFGNGLRKNIWTEFTNRFGIEKICEFYGATEGNANVGNVDGTPGAIGYIGLSWPNFMREILQPLYIIRVDKVTGDPLRNADGFCIKTDIGNQVVILSSLGDHA